MATSKSPGCFIKYTCFSCNSGNFGLVDLGRDLGICMFESIPVGSDAQSNLEFVVLEHSLTTNVYIFKLQKRRKNEQLNTRSTLCFV